MPVSGCVPVYQHDTSVCTALLKMKKLKRRHNGGRGRRKRKEEEVMEQYKVGRGRKKGRRWKKRWKKKEEEAVEVKKRSLPGRKTVNCSGGGSGVIRRGLLFVKTFLFAPSQFVQVIDIVVGRVVCDPLLTIEIDEMRSAKNVADTTTVEDFTEVDD
ncbi:hypothetical protein BHE74_00039543 [Ensete ventricosum]|nr:hypothetical protein GW17_00032748 [Ensete ventricosum]RWW53916.1 hypothetical protein BHE74_00039543 [Ensete ventricosum]